MGGRSSDEGEGVLAIKGRHLGDGGSWGDLGTVTAAAGGTLASTLASGARQVLFLLESWISDLIRAEVGAGLGK